MVFLVCIVYSLIPDHVAGKFASLQKLSEDPFLTGLDQGEGALGALLIRRSDHLEQRGGGSCCKWLHGGIFQAEQFFRETDIRISYQSLTQLQSTQLALLHDIILPARGSVLNSM